MGTIPGTRDGYAPGHYLLEAWRGRVEFGQLKRQVVALQEIWHASSVLIEDAASGQSLIQELQAGTNLPVKAIKPDRDKYSRVAAVCPVLEARRLILPEAAWWREDFLAELTSFPGGAHDDWLDALVQALNHLRANSGFENAIGYLKLECASIWVAEGLSVDEAAARAELSPAEVQNWSRAGMTEGDLGARWDATARTLVAAHRAGNRIDIDQDQYRLHSGAVACFI